jgi:hypothetical protein
MCVTVMARREHVKANSKATPDELENDELKIENKFQHLEKHKLDTVESLCLDGCPQTYLFIP